MKRIRMHSRLITCLGFVIHIDVNILSPSCISKMWNKANGGGNDIFASPDIPKCIILACSDDLRCIQESGI
jgi:hypothetical protein